MGGRSGEGISVAQSRAAFVGALILWLPVATCAAPGCGRCIMAFSASVASSACHFSFYGLGSVLV